MRIDIITLFPELLKSPFEASILKRALDSGKAEVVFHDLRDYSTNKQKTGRRLSFWRGGRNGDAD